jgi:hypothetical protein
MLGRQDIAKYNSGLFVCVNGMPLVQGAWTRRPGMAYLQQTKFHDKVSRLIPFQFSVTQTYVLEFGHNYIRFFTLHGTLTQASQAISGITKANPAVVTYVGADTYANGDRVYISGVVGMTQVNNREFKVANVNAGANTFELQDSGGTNVNSTGYDTYSSVGTVAEIFEVVTTYTESDLSEIRFVQSADVLYILHPDFPPKQLVRTSALSWALSSIAFTDGPYGATNTTATTMTPGAATGATTLIASAVTGINDDQGFLTTDVGRLIRLREGSTWGYAEVTAWTSNVQVNINILSTLTNTNAKATWRLGLWSGSTGYPACGAFYEDRLFLAGSADALQRLDGSKSSSYTNFSPSANDGTIAADNAVAFTLNSDDVNAIRWMAPNEKALLVGTSRGEWLVRASSLAEAVTPTNINGKPASRHGSAEVAPINAGKATLFVQRAGRKVRELAYVFEVDGFKAPDMSVLSEHITRPSVEEIVYQEQPQAIMWGVRGDGVLLGLTYERDQEVVGWHRHELGGFSDSAQTLIPAVESVAVVTDPSATRDELYVIVQRYINGQSRRYVEYMSKLWEVEDDQEDAFHVDCGWTVVNSPASASVTGLFHLEGETVGIYVDGTKHPEAVVTNGKITLNSVGTIVTLGYYYNSDGQTLPIEGGSQDGSAQAKIKKINQIGFWLVDTLGFKYGPDADTLTELIVRQWGDAFGEATPLFTGVVRERFEGDFDKLGQVYWRADGPFPATVLAVMPQFDVADES